MSAEKEYVLGTHDDELHRLGLQHRFWRPRMLDAWMQAGITEGSHVVDLGCGPGYATFDLSETVGARGHVLAIERSSRFLNFARGECARRAYTNVQFLEADITQPLDTPTDFDALWCRWVASFVTDLRPLLRLVNHALRPGGKVIFHEYVDYSTFQSIPRCEPVERFVHEVMASWRASGGEPDIAVRLVPELVATGFEILDTKPILFAVTPGSFGWQWPRSFVLSNAQRLAGTGRVSTAWADDVVAAFRLHEALPGALLLTPTVLQIIASKP